MVGDLVSTFSRRAFILSTVLSRSRRPPLDS